MNKKMINVMMSCVSMLLTIGVMGFAVFAASAQEFDVEGSIVFVANNISANIGGVVVSDNEENSSTFKAKAVADKTTLVDFSNTSTAFSTWAIGDMLFQSSTSTITIRYCFENLVPASETSHILVEFQDSGTNGNFVLNPNVTTSIKVSSAISSTNDSGFLAKLEETLEETYVAPSLTTKTPASNKFSFNVANEKIVVVEFTFSIKAENAGSSFSNSESSLNWNVIMTNET